MPRRIQEKDKRTVYIAYRYGLDENGNAVFGEPIEQKAIVSMFGGESPNSEYGTAHSLSFELLFDKNSATKYINLYTRVWVNKIPITSDDSPDCEITKPPENADGLILVNCSSTAVNDTTLYYEFGGKVLSFVAKDDLENNRFYTEPNVYLPIDSDTKMWYIEPTDIDDVDCTMAIVDKNETKKYIEYTVELDG